MGWDDIIFLFSIGIENIQYLILGPDFSKYSQYIHYFASFFSISIKDFSSWNSETFWTVYKVIVGVSSL